MVKNESTPLKLGFCPSRKGNADEAAKNKVRRNLRLNIPRLLKLACFVGKSVD